MDVLEALGKNITKEFSGVSVSSLCLYMGFALVLAFLVTYLYERFTGKKVRLVDKYVIVVFIFYIGFIAEVTYFNREPAEYLHKFQWKNLWWEEEASQNATNILNILFYVPIGTMIMIVGRKKTAIRNLIMSVCYAFLMSTVVETIKYTNDRGYFEVDNIEANVIGAVVGCLVTMLMIKACIKGNGKETVDEQE